MNWNHLLEQSINNVIISKYSTSSFGDNVYRTSVFFLFTTIADTLETLHYYLKCVHLKNLYLSVVYNYC